MFCESCGNKVDQEKWAHIEEIGVGIPLADDSAGIQPLLAGKCEVEGCNGDAKFRCDFEQTKEEKAKVRARMVGCYRAICSEHKLHKTAQGYVCVGWCGEKYSEWANNIAKEQADQKER